MNESVSTGISLTQRPQWRALQEHAVQLGERHLRELFTAKANALLDASLQGVHYWARIAEHYRLDLKDRYDIAQTKPDRDVAARAINGKQEVM